ncbi:MAG TPA: class I SAM-dependent methyltransferase [Thermoanaerobaculia bacterium]|nr:class I SAM-dependent methyltransferase [Thermoanaerobaculia bacterium]
MRSEHVDRFNHDEDAPGYDLDVRNEADPIRAGYRDVLAWVARQARPTPSSRVLELGSGTGNLTALLAPCRDLLCVDVSPAMTAIARDKLAARSDVRWVLADLLESLHPPHPSAAGLLDRVVSTYAIHHLTPDERAWLFEHLAGRLAPDGRIAVGDLMFADQRARDDYVAAARARGDVELAETVEDEFFWILDRELPRWIAAGLRVETRRLSELSWGVLAAPAG